jgi:hypothetical protein
MHSADTPDGMFAILRQRVYRVCLSAPIPPRQPAPPSLLRRAHLHQQERAAMCARFIVFASFAIAGLCVLPASAEDDITQGTLIWRDDSCFFFVLKTPEGFGLYEFLGGPSPLVGNVFEGKLTGFGGRKLMNVTAGKPTMAYSETFTDSKKQMEKKIPRQCRKKKEFEALEVN